MILSLKSNLGKRIRCRMKFGFEKVKNEVPF
jgi:hypothetical protein